MIRVLHLEDNPDTHLLVERALQSEMVVVWVDTLRDAIARLKAEVFDVILSDLNLPDSRGVDTIAALEPYGVPIVVLSAHITSAILSEVAERGAIDYVRTLDREVLLNRVRFTYARAHKVSSRPPFARKRMESSRFEALKPFITCAPRVTLAVV